MTILQDDRGLTVNKTEDFLNQYNDIGLMCSGGADSTFQLWWLSKCIDELNLHDTHTLLPVHGVDLVFPFDTKRHTIQIIKTVRNFFPRVIIHNPYIIKFKSPKDIMDDIKWGMRTEKKFYFKRGTEKLKNGGLVDILIGGATSAPIFETVDLGVINKLRNHEERSLKSHQGLLVGIDKKFLAYQYKKFDLMETLFPLTKSCVDPDSKGNPCKKCDWCKEKYWAFGCYDGGVI
jgi:hypothetical protein